MNKILKYIFIIILLVVLVFALKAWISNNKSQTQTQTQASKLTMSDVISRFEEEGLKIEISEDKPLFQLIGAKDGIMLYIDNNLVKLYEYENEKKYKEALQDSTKDIYMLKSMPCKELIVLDTKYQKIIDIFNSL